MTEASLSLCLKENEIKVIYLVTQIIFIISKGKHLDLKTLKM